MKKKRHPTLFEERDWQERMETNWLYILAAIAAYIAYVVFTVDWKW
jgi:hypothetical protein